MQETGNLNYFSNQGKLNENAFVQLPMGAVEAKDWLKQQLYLQKTALQVPFMTSTAFMDRIMDGEGVKETAGKRVPTI